MTCSPTTSWATISMPQQGAGRPLGLGGGSVDEFQGSLDGDGYVISGLTVVMTSTAGNAYGGLFAIMGVAAWVSNVGLTSVNIDVTSPFNSYGGGLAGYTEGAISNSYAAGSVATTTTTTFSSGSYGGGLVGYNEGTISNSYATGSVVATVTVSSIIAHGGGLVGYNDGGTISNSYATGSATASSLFGPTYGGLAGKNDGGTISNSYATGFVPASAVSPSYEGGLVGENTGTISNSYWDEQQTMITIACNTGSGFETCSSVTTGLTTMEMQAVTAPFPNGLGAAFQLNAGEYPKLYQCIICTGTLVFSTDLVIGQ